MSTPEHPSPYDAPEAGVVVDATRENFEREALERSRSVPVVVDFWAEWCGPCRRLGPLLERLAAEYGGRFVLVKADTERLGDVASAFGVQGIPAVFGLRDGRVVDAFVGLQSESFLREWLERLLPSPAETLALEAEGLEGADPAAAEARYREAIGLAPRDARPKIGLARVLEAQGRADEARALVVELERRGYLEPEAEAVKARLALDAAAADAGDLASARIAAEADPSDLHARLRLAEALAAAGQHEEALATCLDLVERDRHGAGEQARQTMLAVFNLRPPDDPLAVEYRRKLSFVL